MFSFALDFGLPRNHFDGSQNGYLEINHPTTTFILYNGISLYAIGGLTWEKDPLKKTRNIYFTSREEAGFTRAEASELLEYIPAGRIEKIENEKQNAQPADVLAMARVYQKPELCNYYCTHECPIGKESMQETKDSPLPEIILGMIASLNSLEKQKDRLIEITADGRISSNT